MLKAAKLSNAEITAAQKMAAYKDPLYSLNQVTGPYHNKIHFIAFAVELEIDHLLVFDGNKWLNGPKSLTTVSRAVDRIQHPAAYKELEAREALESSAAAILTSADALGAAGEDAVIAENRAEQLNGEFEYSVEATDDGRAYITLRMGDQN